jgi:hypothetical protein
LAIDTAGALTLAGQTVTAANGAAEEPLFYDDFSTADFSNHNDYFRWGGGGTIPDEGNTFGGIIDSVTGPTGATVNAIRFQYTPSQQWQEVRFHLTTSVSETRTDGTSSTVYPVVWLSYWLYVPGNYVHGSTGDAGLNQKGFATLWKDAYLSNWAQAAWDWIPAGSSNSQLRAWVVDRNGGLNWPVPWGDDEYGNPWTTREASHQIAGSTSEAYAFRPSSDLGRWQHIAMGYKMSDNGSENGYMKLYRDGVLAVERTGMDNYLASPINGLDRGYLLGYHNAVYPETTTFYITGVRFGLTLESVLE